MTKIITKAEVKDHEADCWIIIHDCVCDLKAYLEDHPGGAEALLEHAGKDATQAFEDVGHSEEARVIKEQYKIGDLPEKEKKHGGCSATCSNNPKEPVQQSSKIKDPKSSKSPSGASSPRSKPRSRSRSPCSSKSSGSTTRSTTRDEAAGFTNDKERQHKSVYCFHPVKKQPPPSPPRESTSDTARKTTKKVKDPRTLKESPSEPTQAQCKPRSRSRSPCTSQSSCSSTRSSTRSVSRDQAAGFTSDRGRQHGSVYCCHPVRKTAPPGPQGPPQSWWIYGLVVLGAALVAGIVYQKMNT